MGGVRKSYSERIAAMPCRIRKKHIAEADEYGKMTVTSDFRLYCEAITENKAIEESDRIVVGSQTFEVKGIYNPGELDRHLEIDLLEVT